MTLALFCLKEKKNNIVPVHKKGDKQCLKNYQPVSLLPLCGKILERLMFNEMSGLLTKNNFISAKNHVSSQDIPVLTKFYL